MYDDLMSIEVFSIAIQQDKAIINTNLGLIFLN